jgi:hypothetical protein
MSLSGQNLKIVVSEPFEWERGNLLGKVVEQKDDTLLVKLSKSIQSNAFSSDFIELRPRYQGDTFSILKQHDTLTVGGALVHPETSEINYFLIGTAAID